MSSAGVRHNRGPPLASIESLLSQETRSSGRSALLRSQQEDDLSEEDDTLPEEDRDLGDLDARKQAEEMYRLLSPLAQIDFEHEVRGNRIL